MLILNLFGSMHLCYRDGRVVDFEVSKELLILAVLARAENQKESRKYLSELLWSNADQKSRFGNLRKSVQKLRKLEVDTDVRFLTVTRDSLALTPGSIKTDVEQALSALEKCTRSSLGKATQLVSADLLSGVQSPTKKFARWLRETHVMIRLELVRKAARILEGFEEVNDGDAIIGAVATFALRVDAGCGWARDRLVRHCLHVGKTDQAEDLLSNRENSYEEKAPAGTRGTSARGEPINIARSQKVVADHNTHPTGLVLANPKFDHSGDRTLTSNDAIADLASTITRNLMFSRDFGMRSELVLTGNESAEHFLTSIDDDEYGAFVLLVGREFKSDRVTVELRDRVSGRPVFFDILPGDVLKSTASMMLSAQRLIREIREKLQRYCANQTDLSNSGFGKINRVYELMKRFDRRANVEALGILSELEKEHRQCSTIFAFKTSIYLKQRLFLEEAPDSLALLSEARTLAENAVALDPLHPLNHRYLGFTLTYLGDYEGALHHLSKAQDLASVDPQQMIATAEISAFAGNMDLAQSLCDKVRRGTSKHPPYFFGYMANIAFSSGNAEEAAALALRAPRESMDYRATRIAALVELGRRSAAKAELINCLDYLQRQGGKAIDRDSACAWLCDLVPFADMQIRDRYRHGVLSTAADL